MPDSDSDQPTICFTGKMPEKRSFYENIAKAHNMRPADTVSSTLSILVAVDPNGSSSKLTAARKFGVKIMSLDEFLASVASDPAATKTAGSTSEINEAWQRGELF